MFTGDDIAAGLRENLTAVLVLVLAGCGRYLLDAAARAAAAQLAPKAVREADLAVITAATGAELVAYEDPDFEDAHAAASDGADRTGDLIIDSQMLTSAAAQLAAAATVVTVLPPVLLPLLVLSVIPCAWGARKETSYARAIRTRRLSGGSDRPYSIRWIVLWSAPTSSPSCHCVRLDSTRSSRMRAPTAWR
nr:hypothetical protein [Streptomyces sp. CMB-StM0423]